MSPEENQAPQSAPDGQAAPAARRETASVAPNGASNENGEPESREPAPEWESELQSYPLRKAGEDQRWAVNTVRIWMGFLIFSLLGIMILLVLGLYYD